MFETLIAYGITFAVCALMVRAEVKDDERREKIEEEKARRLKYWLDKCSESRKIEEK